MTGSRRVFNLVLAAAMVISAAAAEKEEAASGARVVHNEKGGKWMGMPRIWLQLVRTIGGPDVQDPNLVFRSPYDFVLDSAGNMYILDAGDNRVQKLSPEAQFLKSFGRRGQGPGEFQSPFSLAVDDRDRLYVFDTGNTRIQVLNTEGQTIETIKFASYSQNQIRRLNSGLIAMAVSPNLRTLMDRTKLPKLVEIIDLKGKTQKAFGDMRDYKNLNVNSTANRTFLDVDAEGNILLDFMWQNRIDKYSRDGTLLWQADRVLNYGTEVMDQGIIERSEKGTMIQPPKMNTVSAGIAADKKGRVWVITFDRQMSLEEQGAAVSVGGVTKILKEPKVEKMNIYELEIFEPDGVLLGEIPLAHHAHGIRIFGDNLFIWERTNTVVYQYKIIEKSETGG
jgi:hypothetical protein